MIQGEEIDTDIFAFLEKSMYVCVCVCVCVCVFCLSVEKRGEFQYSSWQKQVGWL